MLHSNIAIPIITITVNNPILSIAQMEPKSNHRSNRGRGSFLKPAQFEGGVASGGNTFMLKFMRYSVVPNASSTLHPFCRCRGLPYTIHQQPVTQLQWKTLEHHNRRAQVSIGFLILSVL